MPLSDCLYVLRNRAICVLQLFLSQLAHLHPMHPFSTPENIRQPQDSAKLKVNQLIFVPPEIMRQTSSLMNSWGVEVNSFA